MLSINNNDNAEIKRVTHEWLIRFAELYPFKLTEDYYAEDLPRNCNKPGYMPKNPKGSYNPYRTKYHFSELTPGMITRFNDNHVFFYGETIDIGISCDELENTITPNELKCLFKIGRFDETANIHATLTEPMTFSEVWPLIAHCESTITVDIKNLIYDKGMISTLHKHKLFPTVQFQCFNLDISDEAILDFFDFVLSLPVRPGCVSLRLLQTKPVSLGEAIIAKIKCANVGASYNNLLTPTNNFTAIEACEEKSYIFCGFW
uniref:FTH domain-containing protein n=1 Tax=Panagrellus redivivus TaxID=6233 RepID=A0A7E4VM23_PANRE